MLEGHQGLRRATWEWTFETGSHALRLVFGGIFDRFPRATLVLGHMGETLPFLLWRFDSRAKLYGVKLAEAAVAIHQGQHRGDDVGHVLGRAARLHDQRARARARDVCGRLSRSNRREEAAEFIDGVPLADDVRDDICFNNAARLFGLRTHKEESS